MSIQDIKQIMDGFDPAALLPDLSSLEGQAELICRICVLIAPIILLVLGLSYLLLPPREANHSFGYRTWFGMGSIEAWRFTQRLAGIVWGLLGLILTLVMVSKTNGFREMEVMDQIYGALNCLKWEGVCALVSILGINLTVAILFDYKGLPRFRKKIHPKGNENKA